MFATCKHKLEALGNLQAPASSSDLCKPVPRWPPPLASPAGLPQYYKYTAATAGFLTTTVCSNTFEASFNIIGNGTDAAGDAVVMGSLGCGGDFIDCSDPALTDPDSLLTCVGVRGWQAGGRQAAYLRW